MQNTGSLNDFIDVDMQNSKINQLKASSRIRKLREPSDNDKRIKMPFNRAVSMVDEYIASDKSKYKKKQIKTKRINTQVQKKLELSDYDKYLKRREWMLQNKFTLFPKTEPKSYQPSIKLKRGQVFLRAVQKIKRQEEQSQSRKGQYEKSFEGMALNKNRLNAENTFGKTTKERKSFRSLYMETEIKGSQKKQLSNEKRIEYEKICSWARKRNKHSEHYESELGKNIKEYSFNSNFKDRKKILKKIKQKFKTQN